MDLVEKAAQRLAQLQKAGVEAPVPEPAPDAQLLPATAEADSIPTPERLALALERAQTLAPRAATPAAPATEPVQVARAAALLAEPGQVAPTPAPAAESLQLAGTPAPTSTPSKMAHIDLKELSASGFVSADVQRSRIADEFRVIKRPIIRNARDKMAGGAERANLVMVTSAIPSEGKTFVALNLAMSIALEVDSTVLLVDADVANPSIMRVAHLPPATKGLLDVLMSPQTSLSDVLLRTNVEKLSLLPAGTPHRRAAEMMASETMADLLEEMASRYHDRIVVFDSPPLLLSTEARALASHMGQILMVVEADRTTQALVKHALETIESCPMVMMVLNKAQRSEVGGYYGYHYSASAAASS